MPEPIIQSVIVDVETQFNTALIQQARNEIVRLDKSIEDLQKEAAKLGTSSPKEFAKITKEITDLKNVRLQLDDALKKGDPNFKNASSSLGGFKNAAGLAGQALKGLGLAFGLIEFSKFITGSIQAAAHLEKMAKSLQAFGVNAGDAKRIVEELDGLAATLPFEGDQIIDVAKNLIKFNIEAEKTPAIVKQLAAIASGAGFSFEALSDAYGRANATGKVFGRDFLQLYKNIPGLVDAISTKTGKTIQEVVKLGKAGKLGFADFAAGIDIATSATGKYGQVLTEFGNTAEGSTKKLKEAFGDIKEAFGAGVLSDTVKGTNQLTSALQRLVPVAESAGKALGFVLSSVINTLTGKSAFLIQGEIQAKIKEQNTRLAAYLKDQYTKLFTDVKEKSKFPISAELSEEDQEALKKRAEMLAKERATFLKEQADFNTKIGQQIAELLINNSGLNDQEKQIALLRLKLKNQLDQIEADTRERVEKAKKLGIKIPAEYFIDQDSLRQQLILMTERQITSIEREIKPIVKVRPIFEIQAEEEERNKITDDTKKIVERLLNTLFKDGKIPPVKLDVEVKPGVKGTEKKQSVFSKIFNFDDPEEKKKFNENLQLFTDKAISAAETFINTEIQKTSFLIDETKSRLQELLAVQEGGNSSQIRLEQERLDKLIELQEKNQQKQKIIDSAQILANNALSASNSIRAITAAFAQGGNPIVGIAASLALVATIAATIASLNAQFNSAPRFWEGAERVSDKSRASKPGRDGHMIWADGGERIIPTKFNNMIPGFVKNESIPALVEMGLKSISGSSMTDRNITKEQRETNRLLKANQRLLKKKTNKQNFMYKLSDIIWLKCMDK